MNQITEEEAVALAGKHGFIGYTAMVSDEPDYFESEASHIHYFANAVQQQTIERLAQESGVMLSAATPANAKAIASLQAKLEKAEKLLRRYRDETYIGHQPHMICQEVDELLAAIKGVTHGNTN